MKKISVNSLFDRENLIVDYIAFNFINSEDSEIEKLANYLGKIGFNSYNKHRSKNYKSIFRNSSEKNKYVCFFDIEESFWRLNFSGNNAAIFYKLIQKRSINWKKFSSTVLSRFDLYYSRKNKVDDKISTRDFLINCQKNFLLNNRNIELKKNKKGWIFKVGHRKSDKHWRIYETDKSLKFEYEMTGKYIKDYHRLLVSNDLDQLEHEISKDFFSSYGKFFSLNSSYLDWLIIKLRPIKNSLMINPTSYTLNSDYLENQIKMNPYDFICLIQFLKYAEKLHFRITHMEGVAYRTVHFQVRDFLQFTSPYLKPTQSNFYPKLRKLLKTLENFQLGLHITSFSDQYFQSLVLVPQVKLERCPTKKSWMATISLIDDLFYYNYPFSLPDFFKVKLSKLEFHVRYKFIQIYVCPGIEKKFLLKDFLNSYPASLNNKQKTDIKKILLELVKELNQARLIDSQYSFILNDSCHSTDQLTLQDLSEGFILYEKFNLN